MMKTFDLLFIICLAAAIVLFIAALIMFFLFDIHGIVNIKTGRAARKTIKQMEAVNQSTGRLRAGKKNKAGSTPAPRTADTPVVTKPEQTGFGPAPTQPSPQPVSVQNIPTEPDEEQTSLLDGAAQTELLDKETVADSGETELLGDNAPEPQYSETVVLSGAAPQAGGYTADDAGAEDEGLTQPLNHVRMNIIKKMVFRDTDEIIA